MRIVSRHFKDYYDSVQSVDQDRELVYIREPVTMENGYPGFVSYNAYGNRYGDYIYCKNYCVGFCGVVYPCIKIENSYGTKKQFCYKEKDLDRFIRESFPDFYENYQTGKIKGRYFYSNTLTHKSVKKFFEDWKPRQGNFSYIFDEHKCPIFVVENNSGYRESKITFNAHLNEVEFYRVFNPYAAYQEIRMYLSNMAMPNRPIPEISDEVMAEAKGFDKYSFRKDKQNA